MLQLFLYCLLVQMGASSGEQVVRAFVKAEFIKDLNSFINSNADIDQWLSLRSTKRYFDSQYDYFADLRLGNQTLAYLVNKFKIDFELLKDRAYHKSKRLARPDIVGRYVSYDEVN